MLHKSLNSASLLKLKLAFKNDYTIYHNQGFTKMCEKPSSLVNNLDQAGVKINCTIMQ